MTNDEAEKLARKLLPADFNPSDYFLPRITVGDVRALCNHILSGSMKREIKNAAYEREARALTDLAQSWRATLTAYHHRWSPEQIKMYVSAIDRIKAVATAIRAIK